MFHHCLLRTDDVLRPGPSKLTTLLSISQFKITENLCYLQPSLPNNSFEITFNHLILDQRLTHAKYNLFLELFVLTNNVFEHVP